MTVTDTAHRLLTSAAPSASPTIHEEPGILKHVETSTATQAESDPPNNYSEKGEQAREEEESTRSTTDEDVVIVNWEGPDDPQNPKK